MLNNQIFKNPNNELEQSGKYTKEVNPLVINDVIATCPKCQTKILHTELEETLYTCNKCSHHFRVTARQRVGMLTDENSFEELFTDLETENKLKFPQYSEKLEKAKSETSENEAVICGKATINGTECLIFIMESTFMMGSMGVIVGEKITRTFEKATELGLPVIGVTVSGGARMQEGILSLMQMAKVSAAVKRHSDAGNFYLALLTDPTTGGVTASFAMQGDVIIAEPQALIAFTGPRVIKQTTREELPEGFQTAEFLLDKGFVDIIVPRKKQKEIISNLLEMNVNASFERSEV